MSEKMWIVVAILFGVASILQLTALILRLQS